MGIKEYELPNGRKAVFEFDENGVGKITLEAMDLLMGMVNIEFVRCGECIHHNDGLCHRPKWSFAVEPTDFCPYGEREINEIDLLAPLKDIKISLTERRTDESIY